MSRTVVIVLVVVGLGGLVVWWMRRQGQLTVPQTDASDGGCGGGILGTAGQFIKDHVERKNAVAPYVASAYSKIPVGQAGQITSIAGKLDISAPVEQFIGDKVGNALCSMSLPSISAIVGAAGNQIQVHATAASTFATSQLKAGTIAPATDLYSAGKAIARGDVTSAAKNVAASVVDGPKAAYNATKGFLSSINPF